MLEWQDQYNPFNSWKLMAHLERWKPLAHGEAPPPVAVTIDTAHDCNMACPYCNAVGVKGEHLRLDPGLNRPLAKFLAAWGVKAVCVAGGGEPLLNPSIIADLHYAGLQVGVVTNGTLIDRCLATLMCCDWVGVSVDAATPMIYEATKGSDRYHEVIHGIGLAVDRVHTLGRGAGYGVFYKFLILPENQHEIAAAAMVAKSLGCRGFHARPAGMGGLDAELVAIQCEAARSIADEKFGVYTVTHKVGADLAKHNDFKKCWGCMMTCVIGPAKDGRFNVDLCCDRRGRPETRLAAGLTEPAQIRKAWDGKRHWEIHDAVTVAECPRCTYGPHSRLFENAIEHDNMTVDFI